jgi:hypothetical protein
MVTITGENLNSWAKRVSDLALRFTDNFGAQFGYPPGENVLVRAVPQAGRHAVQALSSLGVPQDLLRFYAQVERVSLPDLDNGLFIHPADDVADGLTGNQPTQVAGGINGHIVVFGSDGGGGLIVMAVPDGRILMLRGVP